jgi:RNA polymerase sigma-70 factor (ECF subfamily)
MAIVKKSDDLSDSEVVSYILQGNIDTYSLVVERYEAKLLRYATFLIKDYDMASDLVQDTFIKAYVNLNGFRLDKSFSSWIYRILHNEAMNLIKKNKLSSTFTDKGMTGDEISVKFLTDKHIDKSILRDNLQKCINKVSLKYQEVIVLYYFDHLKYDEISDILHIPTSTVGVRVKRAKAELKKICQNDGVRHE